LPLALDQAGAYIEETQFGLASYLSRYRERRAVLLARRGGMQTNHPEPVATTWALSFEKVEQISKQAADLLRLSAFLHPDVIPEELFLTGNSSLGPHLRRLMEQDLDEAIAALRTYSLVQRDPVSRTFSLHRLVQAVLEETMPPVKRKQ
jgi:hypothetical protein